MKILLIIIFATIISSCGTNKNLRPALNLAVLTVNSEEEFRNIPELLEFKKKVKSFSFEVDVPADTIMTRFKHCWSDGQLLRESQTLVKNETQFATYENSSFMSFYNPFGGYAIGEGWEIDELTNGNSKVTIYTGWMKPERYKNFAKGISEKSSIMYNACKF